MFFTIMVDALSGFRNRYYLNGRQWKRGEKNNRNVCSAANGLMVYRYAQYSLSPHFPSSHMYTSWFLCLFTSYPHTVRAPCSASTIISFSFQKKEIYEIFLPFFSSLPFTRRNAKKALKRFFYNAVSQPATMKLFLFSHLRWWWWWWLQYGSSLFVMRSLTREDVCRWAHVY